MIASWAFATQARRTAFTGVEHIPRSGPVLLGVRHYHHLLDGAMLIRYVGRPVHIVVGLDWASDARTRQWMERACRAAQFPVILRPGFNGGAYDPKEIARYLRSGLRDAANLLRDGRVVVVFPEGAPVIDPSAPEGGALPRDADEFAAFNDGYRLIARLAGRAGGTPVPLVPIGFSYARAGRRWDIIARAGAALDAQTPPEELDTRVRALSR